MEGSRKPLAKVEGRRRMRLSGVTVAWRGEWKHDTAARGEITELLVSKS